MTVGHAGWRQPLSYHPDQDLPVGNAYGERAHEGKTLKTRAGCLTQLDGWFHALPLPRVAIKLLSTNSAMANPGHRR